MSPQSPKKKLNMQSLRAAGQSTSGDRMEVDLTRQLLFVVRGGRTVYTVNTSTGSGALPPMAG